MGNCVHQAHRGQKLAKFGKKLFSRISHNFCKIMKPHVVWCWTLFFAIFEKKLKINLNINIPIVSLFIKNCAKFSKKVFRQIWPIFDIGGHMLQNSPFLFVTPVNWWQIRKKQVEIWEKWVQFPDVTSPGKIGHFCKNDKK